MFVRCILNDAYSSTNLFWSTTSFELHFRSSPPKGPPLRTPFVIENLRWLLLYTLKIKISLWLPPIRCCTVCKSESAPSSKNQNTKTKMLKCHQHVRKNLYFIVLLLILETTVLKTSVQHPKKVNTFFIIFL